MQRSTDSKLLPVMAFVAPFLATPLGMSAYSLIHHGVGGTAQYVVAFAWGLFGFTLVAVGLKQEEVRASVLGFVGGWIMWGGWFEFTFQLFAQVLQIPDLVIAPGVALPGNNGLQLASTPFLIAIFLLFGMLNRQTKCSFMRFWMRITRLSPGMPAQGVARSVARTTALETFFVIWALNSFWLFVFWATGMSTTFYVIFGAYALWLLYLISRLARSTRPGHTIRYGVAVGLLTWIVVEFPAQFGLLGQPWRRPLEHPLAALILLALFVGAIAWMLRTGRSRSSAAVSAV